MVKNTLNSLAITLWFFTGSLACAAAVCLFAVATDPGAASLGAEFWLMTALRICSLATLSGLMVDALRFVASALWPQKLPFMIDVNDLLLRNLAG